MFLYIILLVEGYASENSRPASKTRLGRFSGQRPRKNGRNITDHQLTKQVENIYTHSLSLGSLANLSRTYGNILWIRYVCIFERRFGQFGILLMLLFFLPYSESMFFLVSIFRRVFVDLGRCESDEVRWIRFGNFRMLLILFLVFFSLHSFIVKTTDLGFPGFHFPQIFHGFSVA